MFSKNRKENYPFKVSFEDYSDPMKKLSDLAIGKHAVIRKFDKDDLLLKLMEMGFVPGEVVKIEQIAPLGDPISLTIAGYTLSLRLNEAEQVWVEEV